MIDHDTLRIIWWGLLVLLAIGFVLSDGFDLGIGMLLPFLGKNDEERRVIINTIGPTWEGNQVWFITLGGACFAAWPLVYSAAFSGLYTALLVLLFGLFLRPAGFDFRGKVADPRWRAGWDWALCAGGTIPALVLSLATGNLLLGLPFHLDDTFGVHYAGSFWGLFHPFALLCAVTGMALFCLHGAVYLHWRTEAEIAERTRRVIPVAARVFILGFSLAGVWLALGLEGYQITSAPLHNAASNPLHKSVTHAPGLWLRNYRDFPWLVAAPLLALVGAWLTTVSAKRDQAGVSFAFSALAFASAVITPGGTLFPFIIPSTTVPASSLTVWDASASELTLWLLTFAVILLLPIVVVYTRWVYRVMWGKVTVEQVREQSHSLY
jgi:cytochrome d ubiquinol oxidase subunit II